MISSLFKPAWKSDSADKRREAIDALNEHDEEHQRILAQLSDDPDSSVAIEAIRKLTDPARLLELTRADEAISSQANQRLDHLIGAADGYNEQQYLELLESSPQLAIRVAAQATIARVRQQALEKLPRDAWLMVLEHTPYTDTRQHIVALLTTLADLETARRLLRGKDKTAERMLKQRIDEIHAEERTRAQQTATLSRLVEEAEYLSSHEWLPEFKARAIANRSQWDQLDFAIDGESKSRFDAARVIVDERLQHQQHIDETLESRASLLGEIENLVSATAQRDLASAVAGCNEVASVIELFSSTWVELAAQHPPEAAQQHHYEKMLLALRSANHFFAGAGEPGASPRLLKDLQWPREFGELVSVAEFSDRLKAKREAAKKQAAEHQEQLDKLHKKISSITRLARAGHLGRARQICERVEKSLGNYSGKEQQRLDDRLKEARQTLEKMDDWKSFATEPKYESLCATMEKLVSSDLKPDKVASKIKELQNEWKSLGYSKVSDKYWPRFKEAADKAYQPCADYFAERHDQRSANLEQREHFVEQMRELLEDTDWDDEPDYREIQNSLRKIGDGFNQIKDVERGAGQKQWKRFSRLKDKIYDKLNVEFEQNIALKHKLVEQMSALAQAEPREENLNQLKLLQTRWKQVGITRRGADQKAWKAFKKQSDIVYERIQTLRKDHRADIDKQVQSHRDIIREIQQLARRATDLADADHQFADLQQRYSELSPLPRDLPPKLLYAIEKDYTIACDQFENRHRQIIDNKRQQQIEALRQKAELCARLEALDSAESADKVSQLHAQWDAIEIHDHDLKKRIESRRKSALQTSLDRQKIGEQRRLFCIQLEIATGKESPPEDRDLRTRYQLELMNKSGLGQGLIDSDEQLEEMEIEWLCMPGAEPDQQKRLDERFRRALDH